MAMNSSAFDALFVVHNAACHKRFAYICVQVKDKFRFICLNDVSYDDC